MRQILEIALTNIGWAFLVYVTIKKKIKKKTLSDTYTDYINEERGIIFRVYPTQFEYEAGYNVSPERLLDAGTMDKGYSYYIIKL